MARPDEDGFSPEDVQLPEQIAGQLAIAIENATHFEQAERYRREATAQRDRLRLLLDVNNALVSRIDAQSFELSILERLWSLYRMTMRASRSSIRMRVRCGSRPSRCTTDAA